MRFFSKIFLKGLAAVLPIAITIYILYWLGSTAVSLTSPVIEKALPDIKEPWKQGVLGVASVFVLVFGVGLLMNAWIVRVLFSWGEELLQKIPLVKTLYGSVRDLMGFFAGSEKGRFNKVVMVNLGGTGARILGMVTRESFSDLPDGIGGGDRVAVYLPMSYQVGGFTAIVPRSAIEQVEMSMEEAMRFAVTAGMSTTKPGGEAVKKVGK
jgi:uncharacterized membrane protein